MIDLGPLIYLLQKNINSNAIIMQRVSSLAIDSCQIWSWHAWRNAIFLHRMHLFVNNMADSDISDYEFDADDLFRR